jgi:tetratricopeptide (TPR) repeat protein
MDQHNNDLRAADEHLTEARRLLGGTEEKHLPHHLHLARVYHQLALSRYNRIGRNCEDLKEAEEMNNKAEEESNNEACKEHRDPVLDYGIAVARSLITTDLRNYVEARRSADSAIEMFPKLPRVTHGWAWVAKGMALAGALPDASSDYGEAERAFKQALSEEVRVTDRAAAHLHLALLYAKVGSTDKASIHYDRAIELVPQSEHGWIRDLAKRVEQTLGEKGMGYRCSFDVSELLRHANKDEGAWRYIEDFVSREIRSKLMRLMDSEIRDKGVPAVADELGIGQATLYLWLRQAGIKLDRPRKKTTSN